MIGLLDLDLMNDKKLGIPNVEIMKLSSYYQQEERQFCRLLRLDENDLSTYDKIYIASENENYVIPENYKKAKNVFYCGSGFNNGVYVPFKNKLIDYSIPKPGIYKGYLNEKYSIGFPAKDINDFLDNSYYRCYAGEDWLPMPPIMKRKRVFLYDRDFFYDDWEKIMMNISKHGPSSIARIHPVFCNTLRDFFKIRTYPKFLRSNEIILDIDVPFSQVNVMFKKYELKFKADIGKNSNVKIPIGGTFPTNIQYYDDLYYKLNLLYSFWARKIPVKLYYKKPNIGNYNPIEELSKMIVNWSMMNTAKKRKLSIFEMLKPKSREYQEIRDMVYYDLMYEKVFKQTLANLHNNGYWRL